MARFASSKSLKEKLGGDYDRIAKEGLQGGVNYGNMYSGDKMYGGAEVAAELRERGDRTVDEGPNSMKNYFQGLVDSGSRFNNNAKERLEKIGVQFGRPQQTESEVEVPEETTPEPTQPAPTPQPTAPIPYPGAGPSQGGTQGGDQTSTITGDNNTVSQDQTNTIYNTIQDSFNKDYSDNSVRNFNYTPNGEGLYDQPIGMATASGFFDPNINSAAFVNKFADLNRDVQRENDAIYDMDRRMTGKDNYRGQAKYAQAFDPARMMQRIDNSVQESRDRADVAFNNLYGNMDDFKTPPFQMADRPSPQPDNSQDILEYYMDLLKA
jgi:hypothetical protein